MPGNSLLSSLKRKVTSSRRDSKDTDRIPLPQRSLHTDTTSSTTTEAPPAYSAVANLAVPTSAHHQRSTSPTPSTASDSPYSFLGTFDTIFLIDDSGSMAGSRWTEVSSALSAITPICTAHDSDGIDIHFLNAPTSPWHKNITSASTVREIFTTVSPRAATPTGQRLNQLLRPYLRDCETKGAENVKPLNIIVITDGEPSDDIESPLIAAAAKLDKIEAPAWQVGVQFFQVGRDEGARRHLARLDDELSLLAGRPVRDIVDTVPFTGRGGGQLTGEGILKVVLGAVNRRLDRKNSGELHR